MKRWILLALALLLFVAPVCAAQALPLVVDDAGLLGAEAVAQLSAEARRLSDAYAADVVILTTGGLGGKTALDFAADYYDGKGYGQGENRDGVMLMLSMEERDWCILTTGSGIRAFTDYAIDAVSEDIVPYFSEGDYPGGFARFLRDAQIVLKQAQSAPYDVDNPVQLKTALERVSGIGVYLLIAALIVAIVGLAILMAGMNTARPQHGAGRYIRDGSMRITRAQDIFLYHTQTRTRVEKDSSSSGSRGGSSTFRSSSGGSHGGKSGKF